MKQLLFVALGGAMGAAARWKLSGLVLHHTADWKFPLSTFLVNVIGCIIAGILAGLATKYEFFSADTRLFLITGVLGGFTTFSAFGLEAVTLLRRADYAVMIAYVILSVVSSIAGLWLGMIVVQSRISN